MRRVRYQLVAEAIYAPARLVEGILGWFRSARNRGLSDCHPSARFMPSARVENFSACRGAIQVGERTTVRGQLLTFRHGGRIVIGKWCYIGEDSRIWSASGVTIGDHVLISHGVDIHDTNSHPLSALGRRAQYREIIMTGHREVELDVDARPIVIETDAWVGYAASIGKGVTIGRGAIVAAHSVVTDDVKPWTVVAGNPARVIRTLEPDISAEQGEAP